MKRNIHFPIGGGGEENLRVLPQLLHHQGRKTRAGSGDTWAGEELGGRARFD